MPNVPERGFALSVLVALGAAVAGCTPAAEVTDDAVVDSAGVRIVRNGELSDALLASPQLIARTGWEPDDPTFQELTAGALLDDGRAVVFDVGAEHAYLIDPAQPAVTPVGASGDGPGEFRRGEAIEALADGGFVLFDDRSLRLSRFDAAARYVGAAQWSPSPPIRHRPVTVTREGRLLWGASSFALRRDLEPGVTWVQGAVFTTDLLGSDPDTVAEIDFVRMEVETPGQIVFDPFMRFGSVDGYPDGFVAARNDRPELRWLSPTGELRQIARWDNAPRPVDDGAWAEYEDVLRLRGTSQDRIERNLQEARNSASATLPYFSGIHVASDAAVWVPEYAVFAAPTRTFHVFRPDGRHAGVVEMPNPIRILDLRDGRLLGVETDEWDVQAAVMYELRR